jgi:hypothetical protein
MNVYLRTQYGDNAIRIHKEITNKNGRKNNNNIRISVVAVLSNATAVTL